MRRINTEMRGPKLFGPKGYMLFLSTHPGQPLVLTREPTNPVDANAVICCDVNGVSMGYVARAAAAIVAPDMDRGLYWRAKVTGTPRRAVAIVLWRDEPGSLEEIFNMQKEKV